MLVAEINFGTEGRTNGAAVDEDNAQPHYGLLENVENYRPVDAENFPYCRYSPWAYLFMGSNRNGLKAKGIFHLF